MKGKWLAFLVRLGLVPQNGIYYIGGSDVLPPPLKGEQEQEALVGLEMGDEAAKQRLIEHNLRLVVYISRRFENTGVDLDDLVSVGTIGLIKAVNSFNAEKNIKLDVPVIMDYIEYTNNGKKTVIHPFVRKDNEIDPRSFGDIRESMNIATSTARERANRIFQFMLSSSDYFMSYQARFNPGDDRAANVCYDALQMLNAYCGFECGPLRMPLTEMEDAHKENLKAAMKDFGIEVK